MTRDQVLEKLQTIFDNIFTLPVTVSASLTADDVDEWDSMIHISLILAIEEEFGVRFRTGEAEGLAHVGELADLILKHLDHAR